VTFLKASGGSTKTFRTKGDFSNICKSDREDIHIANFILKAICINLKPYSLLTSKLFLIYSRCMVYVILLTVQRFLKMTWRFNAEAGGEFL